MKAYILDLGLGNLLSLRRGLERAGAEVTILMDTDDKKASEADALVLPGVGGFRDGTAALSKFPAALVEVRRGKPLLGICLGMQLLFTKGFEGGEAAGLDLIKGQVLRLPATVKVPHMGWSSVMKKEGSRLLRDNKDDEFFYFVHSYYCDSFEKEAVSAEFDYGVVSAAAVEKGNIFGTQFHPEKSGAAGQVLLKNFLKEAKR